MPLSSDLAQWASRVSFDDLPADVVRATKWRVLDVIGLALAGTDTPFGRSVHDAAIAISGSGPSRIFGTGEAVSVTMAAFANGAFSQALEYDDTHNESIVHMSSPSVAAALAMADTRRVSGRDAIAAIAVGNEISCRTGSVSPGQFHRRGFHPSGLFATFGVTYLASRLLGLDADATARAAGVCGSFASGILECWVDGTQTKFLHPGWSAQSGIAAAFLARAGTTGPAQVFEGRWGLFATHLQDDTAPKDFSRLTTDLGTRWDSRNSSFKPFPAAHVLHPYIDAVLRLRHVRGVRVADIESIVCPVAPFIIPIVCEPQSEKLAPASDSHGRVSLQYTLAEAFVRGSLGRHAYSDESLRDPAILALARRVSFHGDPTLPGPGRFKGVVSVALKDGTTLTEVEEYNRGSAENPMSDAELRAKFDENAEGRLDAAGRDRLAAAIERLESLPDARALVDLAVAP
ncbi:MAG TPA: MmgE/PrpD family protein [Vicinamibacterales bacterium]|nr:MmgE/PrpD family protein [Vicinamibacterales bacterium]